MQTGHLFRILNLDHWKLFEIWFLMLGIFMILLNQVISEKPVNYLA
jgi:hypothetical protein